MKTIVDSVFGNMEYDYGWKKTEELTIFNRYCDVDILAEAYEDDQILDVQREAYKKYMEMYTKYVINTPKVLLKYYLDML